MYRLWAATGQTALENAKICLLNATSTGCEILKNLVLPGIGSVTVVDHTTVNDTDIRANFFLEPSNINHSKAESAAALLKELNEDASVSFENKCASDLIRTQPEFFDQFSMVIATNLVEQDVLALGDICDKTKKTLVTVHCKGLFGLFRIQAPEHAVVETHPENVIDLRLGCPFKELLAYVDTIDLDSLDQTDHGHVPFVVVLLKYVNVWKEQHNGQTPQTYGERNELKNLIKSGMRKSDEENFEEAVANVWRLSSTSTVDSSVREILEDPAAQNLESNSDSFWIITRAIKDFVDNEGEGQLPLSGKLPDMKSDTENYIDLQNVFRQKAMADLAAVKERVERLLEQLKMPIDSIPDGVIEGYCKNAATIKVIRYRTLRDEYVTPSTDNLVSWLRADENIIFYILFRAAEKFAAKHNRYPGAAGGSKEEDIDLLTEQAVEVLKDLGVSEGSHLLGSEFVQRCIKNYVQSADREMANMAALMGGLIAQEAIKLITRQYVPINNTCIFNGIASTSNIYAL
ncbi:putative NEDD8-activating enzyme E1 regulatory subunit [Zychaea mexicana]|uniref:putative NEDD8-activating enzyme E1 regulatory subunit n=1 Tax=Zychaea mexicana TaxID=64656 RepID=UPI0022FE91DD|nr:putative NEDD8-activating enzyme E1 regulatory subunit [Zychaea mexicana]KAI9496705.1 putative NEDD8-activating enzyme E1 regulatory subunit [Zychaea mexicana]